MTRVQNKVDNQLVRGLSLFKGLDDRRLLQLASLFATLNIPADSELFHEGRSADHLYILLQGRMALSVTAPGKSHHETIVATLSRGQLLGWSALLSQSHWKYSAHSVKPCRLLYATGEVMRDLCERDHEIGYHLMKNALAAADQRLADSQLQLLNIFGNADA